MNGSPANEEITEYYDDLHFLYNKKWSPGSHRANIHLGYHDEENPNLGDAVENMKRTVTGSVNIGSDDRVLDCSGGLGDNPTWTAKNLGAEVVAININENQLEEGRELAVERGVSDRVTFKQDDFTKMETLDDDSFDVVMGHESICYADDKRDFLEQAERVLKDDGRIVVADWYMTKRKSEMSWLEKRNVKGWLEGWVVPNYAHIDDFLDDMNDLGFQNVTCQDATDNTAPSTKRLYFYSLWAYPLGKLLQLFGRSKHIAGNARACYHMHKAYMKDLCIYGIVSAEL